MVKGEKTEPKTSRREITQMRVKINEIEGTRATEETNQSKTCFLQNTMKIDKPLAR